MPKIKLKYIGKQETGGYMKRPFLKLYNVLGGKHHGTTVTDLYIDRLKELGIGKKIK